MYLSICRYILYLYLAFILIFPAYGAATSPIVLKNKNIVEEFYFTRSGNPLWVKRYALNSFGNELLNRLRLSWQNGLNPQYYNVYRIDEILASSRRLTRDQTLDLELLLTDGYISYVRDLSGIRINARDIGLDPKDWRQRISAQQALELLNDENIKNIDEFLLLREPQSKTYQKLKEELIKQVNNYKLYGDQGDLEFNFKGLVVPGRGYNDIPKLRRYFNLPDVEDRNRYLYDDVLVKAVMDFQKENGLKPDGIIGKQTLHILNLSTLDKIKKIIVNMERLRWVDDKKPERFIVVNIPSAMLWAIDNGQVKIEMPVIVGRKKRPTKSFVTNIHGVRFNPTWTVPPTIKFEDMLPKLQEDPNYLSGKGVELYDGYDDNSPTIDPLVIDWNNIDEEELSSLRMVQIPGKHNPLGAIRVLMPNEYNIYLHDTNDKSLFYRSNRAKSSGCVRMKYPEEVAKFILESRNNWDNSYMVDILNSGKTKDIYISEKVVIYLLYYTMWLGDNSKIVYGFDVYNYDEPLLKLLGKLDEFYFIGDNDDRIAYFVD